MQKIIQSVRDGMTDHLLSDEFLKNFRPMSATCCMQSQAMKGTQQGQAVQQGVTKVSKFQTKLMQLQCITSKAVYNTKKNRRLQEVVSVRCARPFAAAKCSLGQARHMRVAASSGSRAEDVRRYSCQAWQLAPNHWPVLRLL